MNATIVALIVIALLVPGKADDNMKLIVSGLVTDINNHPVADALLSADNLKTDKTSDKKGFFRVEVKPGVKTISAFASGHGSGEVEFNGEPIVHIVLKKSSIKVEGHQDSSEENKKVAIGYGEVGKKDATSPASRIDAKRHKYDSYTNIYQMIQGEIPNVEVNGTKIMMRGTGTIFSGTDPLFVVDGSPVSSLEMISPRDVKSISVLKGADAANYGTRGGNGVILIELKKAGN